MKALVTGCAGFIGSNLCEYLLDKGSTVTGIDNFSDYYPRTIKEKNLENLRSNPRFSFIERDLNEMTSYPKVEYVFHLAAQAGVRASWGEKFHIYIRNNIEATQKLLEWYTRKNIKKFVYASSSSVYGNTSLPMSEESSPRPVSPYGVTKLAAEHLCYLYWMNFQVPTVSLRYFTVYGPRQRPDMAINKFFHAILNGTPIHIFGDGAQTRDFTYVSDIVDATTRAALSPCEGEVFNIGGGNTISVIDLVRKMEDLTGKKAILVQDPKQKGDVNDTMASMKKARDLLHWSPQITISRGLEFYCEWIQMNSYNY